MSNDIAKRQSRWLTVQSYQNTFIVYDNNEKSTPSITFLKNYKQNVTKLNTNKCLTSMTKEQIKTPTIIISKTGIA